MIGFVHIPKTGGTSAKFILRSSFGLRHCDVLTLRDDGVFGDEELRFAKRLYPGLRSISGHHIHPWAGKLTAPIQYLTFLRDPVRRCASHYQQQASGRRRRYGWRSPHAGELKPRLDLEEFLEVFGNYQTRRIAGSVDLHRATRELEEKYFFVGLTDRYDESLRVLQRLSPYPIRASRVRRKVAPDDSIKQKLLGDPATRVMIEEANVVDQQLYDLVCRSRYPDQLEKAGLSRDEQPAEPLRIADWRDLARYRMSRAYRNGVYRQAIKLKRRLQAR